MVPRTLLLHETGETPPLAAAESLKENHRYTTSNKISMSPLLVFVEARETLLVRPIGLSAHVCVCVCWGGGWGGVGRCWNSRLLRFLFSL